jgi:hypothetical protein
MFVASEWIDIRLQILIDGDGHVSVKIQAKIGWR